MFSLNELLDVLDFSATLTESSSALLTEFSAKQVLRQVHKAAEEIGDDWAEFVWVTVDDSLLRLYVDSI